MSIRRFFNLLKLSFSLGVAIMLGSSRPLQAAFSEGPAFS